jgi:hypothetical protein
MAINLKKPGTVYPKKKAPKRVTNEEIASNLLEQRKKDHMSDVLKYSERIEELEKNFANLSDEFLKIKSNISSYLEMMKYSLQRTLSETKEITVDDIAYNVNMVKRLVERDYNDAKKKVELKNINEL